MSAAEPAYAEQIRSSVESGISAAGEALSQALELPVQLELGDVNPWDPAAPPAEWNADGVSFLWQNEALGTLVLIPESIGLFPAREASGVWSDEAQSQMTQLAESLSQVFGSGEPPAEKARALYASPLLNVITCAELGESALVISLTLRLEEFTAVAFVVGPVKNPDDIVPRVGSGPPEPAAESFEAQAPDPPGGQAEALVDFESGLERLPDYARSLLKISVPLCVVLAAKKQPLSTIMRLVPGSIIQFDKSCDAVLDLEVADQRIASGEAVKVDDNFGLRITSVSLPGERFRSVGQHGTQ